MTLAAERWPVHLEGRLAPRRRIGFGVVWRAEVVKLSSQIRVRVAAALCLLVPFGVAGVFKVQSGVPQDTLFGQWIHSSGSALPLVILGFSGQWALPLLTAVVAGDIFSSEDHFGTWKSVLTRSRSRADVFIGKFTAAMTYTVVMLALLTGASLVAAIVTGTKPLVGLSGQLVGSGQAERLILASWATQLAPLLGFCALAVVLSVATRNSAVGMGGPMLVGLVMQLLTLVNLPESVRSGLLATPFVSWHGFWVLPQFAGPFYQGLVTSAAWFIACTDIAWVIFRHRSIGAS
jgi:ABC-2 type transport system permease protein